MSARHSAPARRGAPSWLCPALVVLVALAASLPVLMPELPYVQGQDLLFHLHRIDGIAQGLRDGQFPVRMQTVQLNGYGYPVSVCYGDLLLYLPALLRLAGLPMRVAYGSLVVGANLLCAGLSYACLGRMFGSRAAGLLACVLWTLCPYRLLDDVWLRGAVGEYLALGFFPAIAYGLWSVFMHDREGASRMGWLWCAAGAAGVVYSHVLSVVLAALLFVPLLAALLVMRHDARALRGLALAALAALGLCLAFAVPFLDYYTGADLAVVAAGSADNRIKAATYALSARQLLDPAEAFNLCWAGLAGAAIWLVSAILPRARRAAPAGELALGWVTLAVAAVLAWASSAAFPWGVELPGPLDALVSALSSIQFSWRLVGPLSFALVLLSCAGVARLSRVAPRGAHLVAAALAVACAVEAALGLWAFAGRAEGVPEDYAQLPSFGGVAMGEYLPAGADPLALLEDEDPEPVASGDVTVASWSRQGARVTLEVTGGAAGGDVTLPLLAYPHYEISSRPSGCSLGEGPGARLCVSVPAGYEGEVSVFFSPPRSWDLSLWASWAVAAGCACAALLAGRRTPAPKPAAGRHARA